MGSPALERNADTAISLTRTPPGRLTGAPAVTIVPVATSMERALHTPVLWYQLFTCQPEVSDAQGLTGSV